MTELVVVYWSITLWAFLGRLILFRQAWRRRKRLVNKLQSA
jgi:low affinity Fe/Cu permease